MYVQYMQVDFFSFINLCICYLFDLDGTNQLPTQHSAKVQ